MSNVQLLWGTYRSAAVNLESSGGPRIPLLSLAGYDEAAGRGIYQLTLPQRHVLNIGASRWRLQLGAKYTF